MNNEEAQKFMERFTTQLHNIVDYVEDRQASFDELDIETWNYIKPNWDWVSIDYDAVDGTKEEIKKFFCLFMEIYSTITAMSNFEISAEFNKLKIQDKELLEMEDYLDLSPTDQDEDPIGTYLSELDY